MVKQHLSVTDNPFLSDSHYKKSIAASG